MSIAIVGRSCLLPGALSPEALTQLVFSRVDAVHPPRSGRFGVPLSQVEGEGTDRSPTILGGYVEGFETVWNPDGFGIPAAQLAGLDPLVHWLLHCGRTALHEAGISLQDPRLSRTGAIFGNLSFPTEGMSAWGEAVMLSRSGRPAPAADPRNHLMSGLPADLLKAGLGLGGESFALDAACASSLYAIALGIDALQAGRLDYVLAGAVNRSDPLFIHIGFHALGAISPGGQSRPFHRDADGLVPAEGCGFVVLRRLEDAERDGDHIYGVIRGVGLSNDGRARNLLAPSTEGQARAMRAALETAQLPADQVQYVECHATGTSTGDATELKSIASVYGQRPLAIGSLKSNLGHLITVAGVAGLLKVLGAMERGEFPPMIHTEAPRDGIAPFRVIGAAEPWQGPRRAGVSAFGFGGNNAHLLVEQYQPGTPRSRPLRREALAVVGLQVSAGSSRGWEAVHAAVTSGAISRRCSQYPVDLNGLRFPPNDLKQGLAQQGWLLQVAREAVGSQPLSRERTGVFVGMGADGAVTGWGLRWRLSVRAPGEELLDAAAPGLKAEHVVGTMPNIPANRISVQVDAAGPGFTVSAEELSGIRALEVAADRLAQGELDTAIVGAVDLADEPRLRTALTALGQNEPGCDAAVALVVRRLSDTAGLPVIGVLDWDAAPAWERPAALGHAHAAAGLLDVALALLDRRSATWSVTVRSVGGAESSLRVSPRALPAPTPAIQNPVLLMGHTLGADLPARQSPQMESAPPLASVSVPPSVQLLSEVEEHWEPPTTPPESFDLTTPEYAPGPEEEYLMFSDPRLAFLRAQSENLARIHQAFLDQQLQAQQQFLRIHAATSGVLTAIAAGGTFPEAAWNASLENAENSYPIQDEAAVSAPAVTPAVSYPPLPPVTPVVSFPAPTPVSVITPAVSSPPPAVTPAVSSPPPAVTPVVSSPPPAVTPVVSSPSPAVTPVVSSPAEAPKPRPSRWAPGNRPPLSGLPGPKLSRTDLEQISHRPIAEVLGADFDYQSPYAVVVRMPEPPLLLADRVTGIEGPAKQLGKGTIWTETDVKPDSWYLEDGHMPPGILIESGQADLLLVSWQGIDQYNQGERVYRLLGCELMYKRPLPKPGETLRYAIQVDGHARLGGIRMFFFHYDCWVGEQLQIQIREGQAGFFSVAELAESGGCLWTPETHELDSSRPLTTGPTVTEKRSFSREELDAAAEGRQVDCFGPSFKIALNHTHSPRMGQLRLMDRVTEFSPRGGPWGRGYLRAELDIHPDLWFFKGHFNNDPCMPGTLMFDGCMQAMQLFLLGLGFGINNDGYRFEPAKDQVFKLICRGQVIPTSKKLTYELFVEAVWDKPSPRLRAQVLCTVDGLKCFHADPLEVELVADWPMSRMTNLLADYVEPKPCEWDYRSLLACAYGKPSDAFGPMYAPFDSPRRCARLPSPPYHFLSRVTQTTGGIGAFKAGSTVIVEYDVPVKDWYFEQASGVMPFAVLLEAGLQPCGWLASFVGSALQAPGDLLFRNLDGKGTLHVEVLPESGTLRTYVTLKNINRSGGMIIEGFAVKMVILNADGSESPLFDFDTVFGFFPPESFVNQVGLPPSDAERAALLAPSDTQIDLKSRPTQYFGGISPAGHPSPRLPPGMLCMIDRIRGYWPNGSPKGLARWVAEKDVVSGDWYFKAHFYSDPVQPGSLGVEAMIQVLQLHMIHRGYGKEMVRPRFQGLATGRVVEWRYRGQVVPKDAVVMVELDVVSEEADTVTADAWLWVDGRRIYKATGLAMRVVDDGPEKKTEPLTEETGVATSDESGDTSVTAGDTSDTSVAAEAPPPASPPSPAGGGRLQLVDSEQSGPSPLSKGEGGRRPDEGPVTAAEPLEEVTETVPGPVVSSPSTPTVSPVSTSIAPVVSPPASPAPEGQTIVLPVPIDHCPTWVLPALPMTTMAFLALQASGQAALKEATALRWITFPNGPRSIQVVQKEGRVLLVADGQTCFIAVPTPMLDVPTPPALEHPSPDATLGQSLYQSGRLFHGPAYQILERFITRGNNGVSVILRSGVSPDILLDGATHGVPHDALETWFPSLPAGKVGYPLRLRGLKLLGRPPTGVVRCELRALGMTAAKLPILGAWLYEEGRLVAWMEWEEALLPKGRIGDADPDLRLAFLQGNFVPGLTLAHLEGDRASLSAVEVAGSDWLPGTVERVYGTKVPWEIAAKELVSQRLKLHPGALALSPPAPRSPARIWDPHHPLRRRILSSQAEEVVILGPQVEPDMEPVARWWRRQLGRPEGEEGAWPGERLVVALAKAYLGELKLEDPAALARLKGRPVLYLANHETYLESVIFTVVMSMIGDIPVEALAKVEHREAWLGRLHDMIVGWPTVKHPGAIVYFNQQNPAELPKLVKECCRTASLLVHVEGTRQIVPGQAVEKISSLWVDLAVDRDVPIVPVAFRGGIGDGHKHDVPQGCARQAFYVGTPILPADLAARPYAERRKVIAERINALGQPAPIPVHQPVLEGRRQVDEGRFGKELAGVRAATWGLELLTQAERALAPEWGRLIGV